MDPNVGDILPQQPPMILIDRIVSAHEGSAVAEKTFPHGAYGSHEGHVLEPALIECLAQTVAALQGTLARRAGEPPAPGLLGGVSDFAFHRTAACGRVLRLVVAIERHLGPLCLARGRVEQDGDLVAEGSLTFRIDEPRR